MASPATGSYCEVLVSHLEKMAITCIILGVSRTSSINKNCREVSHTWRGDVPHLEGKCPIQHWAFYLAPKASVRSVILRVKYGYICIYEIYTIVCFLMTFLNIVNVNYLSSHFLLFSPLPFPSPLNPPSYSSFPFSLPDGTGLLRSLT